MSRKENYDIGGKAEDRIKSLLSEHGEVTQNLEHDGCPDFYFQRHHYTTSWAVEFKTMRGVNAGGEAGAVKVSEQEIKKMSELHVAYCRMLLVEIRPRGAKPEGFLYFTVNWSDVVALWKKRTPRVLDVGLWWILRNGIRLPIGQSLYLL